MLIRGSKKIKEMPLLTISGGQLGNILKDWNTNCHNVKLHMSLHLIIFVHWWRRWWNHESLISSLSHRFYLLNAVSPLFFLGLTFVRSFHNTDTEPWRCRVSSTPPRLTWWQASAPSSPLWNGSINLEDVERQPDQLSNWRLSDTFRLISVTPPLNNAFLFLYCAVISFFFPGGEGKKRICRHMGRGFATLFECSQYIYIFYLVLK